MRNILDVFSKDKENLGDLLDTSDKSAKTSGSAAAPSINLENSASSAALKEAGKKKRGKNESGKPAFSFDDGGQTNAQAAEQAEIFALVFKPETWKGVVAAPADFAFAMTGRKHWLLTEPEKETLASTGCATFRAFAQTDPKWIALTLFSVSLITIYGGRMMKDAKEMRSGEKKNISVPLAAATETRQ